MAPPPRILNPKGEKIMFSDTHEPHGIKKNNSSEESQNTNPHAPMRITRVKPLRYSAHSLQWKYRLIGKPQRTPDKIVQMKNWKRRFWKLKGVKLIANLHTLEAWVKTGKHTNPEKAINTAWLKVHKTLIYFLDWQRIAIEPIKTNAPANLSRAHMVLETKELNPYLRPQEGQPGTERVGLVFDKSHKNKPEFIGQQAAEGMIGADWVFLRLPAEWEELKQAIGLLEGENRATAQLLTQLVKVMKK